MKQNYSITILGTNRHEIHDLIRGKREGGEQTWNRCKLCPRNTWPLCYRIKVKNCITHSAHLDISISLPGGTWKLTSRKNARNPVLEDSDDSEYPDWLDHGFLTLRKSPLVKLNPRSRIYGEQELKTSTSGFPLSPYRVASTHPFLSRSPPFLNPCTFQGHLGLQLFYSGSGFYTSGISFLVTARNSSK